MDIVTVITGIASLAFMIVPVIYIQYVKKKERREFLGTFMNAAAKEQLVISQHEFWSHYYAIGLDITATKLFYLNKREDKEQKILLDLTEVASCSILNTNKTVDQSRIIERLELKFTFKNSRTPEKTITFFNKEESISLNDEVLLIEKWKTLINSKLGISKKLAA